MAEPMDNIGANQQLNKARWMQALHELEREYVAFQTSPGNSNSARHGREAKERE
jgi:hypothetical protein